jgi:transcriptional regulator with XRE-family HTH domain
MKDRLLKFLTREQLSSARFAEIIGVQPSGISHILSGRNKPGFDFIQKILENYPALNAEWLIMGRGNMFKQEIQGDLFSQSHSGLPLDMEKREHPGENRGGFTGPGREQREPDADVLHQSDTNVITGRKSEDYKSNLSSGINVTDVIKDRIIDKIVIFYSDRTFSEYSPGN